jgi:hypothetical protein
MQIQAMIPQRLKNTTGDIQTSLMFSGRFVLALLVDVPADSTVFSGRIFAFVKYLIND